MDKPREYSRRTWQTSSALTIRQLEELWPSLRWPDQPLPVMDVGCGPGDIAAKFLALRVPEGTKIVACDVCPEMLEYAREHNAVPGVVRYELFDVVAGEPRRSSVWGHAPYCKVFALQLLHWLPDNRGAIRNIHKLLTPGGEAIFVVIPKSPIRSAYEVMAKDPLWKPYMQDVERFTSPYYHSEDPVCELTQLLVEEGFQVLHSWSGPAEISFKTEEEMRELVVSLNAFLNRVPQEQKEDYISAVLREIYKLKGLRKERDFGSGETKLLYSYMSMVVVARKL